MDVWNRIKDCSRGGGQEEINQEHICITHGHRKQCSEGLGWAGGGQRRAKGGKIGDICNAVNNF